jgi:phage-related minor tail protein
MLAVGRHLLFRQLGLSGVLLIVALLTAVILVRSWPAITDWIERRWRNRGPRR